MLHIIFKATTLSKLIYASPAWWGFTSAQDRDKLEAFLRKARKADLIPPGFPMVEELCDMADIRLFKAVTVNCNHVLHHLLPEPKAGSMTLRKRTHNYTLPVKHGKMDEANFMCRMLYQNVY